MAKRRSSPEQLEFDFSLSEKSINEETWSTAKPKTLLSSIEALNDPVPYAGLYGFHKYWGKKPVEVLRFLISELTFPDDLVVDPFLGSGAIGRESYDLGRRFIGTDINPLAIRLSKFYLNPCNANDFGKALEYLAQKVRSQINASYTVEPFGVSSHILWEGEQISNIWQVAVGKRTRHERTPASADIELAHSWDDYQIRLLRPLKFYRNSRINSTEELTWKSLFTGRALRNIELLLTAIQETDGDVREALELTLTASAGQMSQMVFAITSRGKKTGVTSTRVEVGSWVIGYWCPKTHFELNVWNCFETRGKKLQKALKSPTLKIVPSKLQDVVEKRATASIEKLDALALLRNLPSDSIQLLITDPPHGDRIPYLELSEMWNGLLGEEVMFHQEIGVSNAKGREQSPMKYQLTLDEFFSLASDRIKKGGFLALMFNSRRERDWLSIRGITESRIMKFVGCFPMEYSATSVVQDNRDGSMKNDYVLLYSKGDTARIPIQTLPLIPGWQYNLPK